MRNSNSTQILSSIICCKQFFSLTKAVHGTACTTSAVGLQVLRSRLAHRDLSKKGAIEQAQLGRASLAPCFYNFNNAPVRLERHVVSERSKTIPAWWLASNLRSTLLAVECHINDQKSGALLTHTADLGRFGHTWGAN